MKCPVDSKTFAETIALITENNKMNEILIQKMSTLLSEAMDAATNPNEGWYEEAETLFKDLHSLRMYHESRRFNENNFRQQFGFEPKEKASEAIERLNEHSELPVFEPEEETREEMSEGELDQFFTTARKTKVALKPAPKAVPQRKLQQMSDDEIAITSVHKLKELVAQASVEEIEMDNATDIYKIKARIANLARGPGMQLTAQGVQLCNTFVHVLKSFYDFADKIPDQDTRARLIRLTRSHESAPGVLIAAAGAGVVQSEKDKDKL